MSHLLHLCLPFHVNEHAGLKGLFSDCDELPSKYVQSQWPQAVHLTVSGLVFSVVGTGPSTPGPPKARLY